MIGYQSHVIWPHRAAVWADIIDLLIPQVLHDVECQLHRPWLEPAVLMIDSESKEVKSRRRQSCSVRDSSAAVNAQGTSLCTGRVHHLERHCASDGFFCTLKANSGVLRGARSFVMLPTHRDF